MQFMEWEGKDWMKLGIYGKFNIKKDAKLMENFEKYNKKPHFWEEFAKFTSIL